MSLGTLMMLTHMQKDVAMKSEDSDTESLRLGRAVWISDTEKLESQKLMAV
ncbi:hypothetical protein Ancab_005524 [Ancistrocladus abbreviatus]